MRPLALATCTLSLMIFGQNAAIATEDLCEDVQDKLNSFLLTDQLRGKDWTYADYIQRAIAPVAIPVEETLDQIIIDRKLPALNASDRAKLLRGGFDFTDGSTQGYSSVGAPNELVVDQQPGDRSCHNVALFSVVGGSLKLTSRFDAWSTDSCFGELLVVERWQRLYPVIVNVDQSLSRPTYEYSLSFFRDLAAAIEPNNTYCEIKATFKQGFLVEEWSQIPGPLASRFEMRKAAAGNVIERIASRSGPKNAIEAGAATSELISKIANLLEGDDAAAVSALIRSDDHLDDQHIDVEETLKSPLRIEYPNYTIEEVNGEPLLLAIGSNRSPDSSRDSPRFAIFSLSGSAPKVVAAGSLKAFGTFSPPASIRKR